MAVVLDATVGGASANVFATLAEAASYLEGRLNATSWETSATTDNKNRALVEATRELSNLRWSGTRADDTQTLAWPRQWVCDPDASTQGTYYASTEIPQRVKDATMELAFQFIKAGSTDVAALPSTDGVLMKQVDVLITQYAAPSQRASGLSRYPRVMAFIAPLLENSTAGALRMVRG